MKNITKIIWLWVLILLPLICYSADSTVEKLPPSSPASESIFYVVDKPFTSGASDNRLSLGNLLLWMATQNWTFSGTVTLPVITLADASTLTLPAAVSAYDPGLLGCSTDGTCSWIDPTSLLTSVDLSSVTITGGTENSIAIWDGSQNLTGTTTPALGTPASGTLTNCSGLPASGLVPSTSQAVGFGTIELGHASDTTISRTAAGIAAIEGNVIGGALTPVIGDADDFDDNFTGVNLYGGTYIVSGAGTIILPEATAGMNFTIVLEGAVATIIDPLGTGTADTIYMNGLAAAADENITSSTLGAMCVFQYRAANTWMATCNGFAEATPP
jgi:hypothetical protein